MSVRGADQHIKPAVSAWEGITAHLHRFGGTAYRLGDREIGHIHGDGLVDIPFPPTVKHELVAAGQAAPHHVLPESGWISFYLPGPGDLGKAIALPLRSYEIAVDQPARAMARRVQRPQ